MTFSCAESVSVAVTFPGPRSFLRLPGAAPSLSEGVSVGLQFRTWNDAGLLLTFDLPEEGGVAWLYLSEARLRLQIHKAGGALLELSAGRRCITTCIQLNLPQKRLNIFCKLPKHFLVIIKRRPRLRPQRRPVAFSGADLRTGSSDHRRGYRGKGRR